MACTDEWNKVNYILKYNLQYFADGDGGEKTEDATDKKLRDAREEGKVSKSRELGFAFDLLVMFLVLKVFVGYVGTSFLEIFQFVYGNMADFLKDNGRILTSVAVSRLLAQVIGRMFLIVLPFFVFGFVITVLVTVLQVGWKVTTKPMLPKLSKFNPINGFKRILSKDSLFELVKSIAKIGLIAYVAYASIKGKANMIFILYELSLNEAVALLGDIIIDVGLKLSIVYMIVGIVDFAYQKHKFKKEMKMTKQEIKDEYKNTEGDPQIKGRIRSKMQEASRRRMMQDVPKADVVITNPTHYAVALKYNEGVDVAPRVVAKGEQYLAQKIKEIAKENNVPLVENKPVARMLYHNIDLGELIPAELYQAVAEILASVYNAKHGR